MLLHNNYSNIVFREVQENLLKIEKMRYNEVSVHIECKIGAHKRNKCE